MFHGFGIAELFIILQLYSGSWPSFIPVSHHWILWRDSILLNNAQDGIAWLWKSGRYCFLCSPLRFHKEAQQKQKVRLYLNWGNINTTWEEMEFPLYEKCYDVSTDLVHRRGCRWSALPKLLPKCLCNQFELSVPILSSQNPVIPQRRSLFRDTTISLALPITPAISDVLMEQMYEALSSSSRVARQFCSFMSLPWGAALLPLRCCSSHQQ